MQLGVIEMFIRAYLRASTDEQDAERAKEQVRDFAEGQGHTVAAWYAENASGAAADRPELKRLLSDAGDGDVLLVESIDRLSRLSASDWKELRAEIDSKGVHVVAVDLPTSHAAMTATGSDDLTGRMLDAVNAMLLDMLAAMARMDYDKRRERQRQGIEKAKERGVYAGRPEDKALHERVIELLDSGFSYRKTANIAQCSTSTVQRIRQKRDYDRAADNVTDKLEKVKDSVHG